MIVRYSYFLNIAPQKIWKEHKYIILSGGYAWQTLLERIFCWKCLARLFFIAFYRENKPKKCFPAKSPLLVFTRCLWVCGLGGVYLIFSYSESLCVERRGWWLRMEGSCSVCWGLLMSVTIATSGMPGMEQQDPWAAEQTAEAQEEAKRKHLVDLLPLQGSAVTTVQPAWAVG